MLNIIHVTEDHSIRNTGITEVVSQISSKTQALLGKDGTVCIMATGDGAVEGRGGVAVESHPVQGAVGRIWRWSPSFSSRLEAELSRKPSVLHIHGVWMSAQWQAARAAAKLGAPVILSSHGMLEPWLWENEGRLNKLKKAVYWKTFAYPAFRKADVIHAITPLEAEHLSGFFPGKRIALIPNSIDTSQVDRQTEGLGRGVEPVIFYIGRLHRKKGIELLIKAFAASRLSYGWRLVIAGSGGPEYLKELKELARKEGVEDRAEFVGPVYGKDKWRLYRRAWVVVAPSYSEVAGMVNLEAAAAGTPTVTTRQTGLYDWEDGGGILVEPVVEDISGALLQAVSWTMDERLKRGIMARKLVQGRYSLEVNGKKWIELYKELSEKG